jgi:hypothetical protein
MNINIKKVKIIVTVPSENVNEVRNAMSEAGAGEIGNYTHCSIISDCIGTFKGNDESNPYIGKKNRLEVVKEIKLEMQCDIEKVVKVLKTLRNVHPYEEPAIDIIPLIDEEDLK